MSTNPPSRATAGAVDLRALHVADTKRRILGAVHQLLTEEHPASITVSAVARRSGIAVATIYRHFHDKEALLDAAAAYVDLETRAWLADQPIVPGQNLRDFLRRMWVELAKDIPALRASQLTPAGRDIRRRRSDRRKGDAIRGLTEAGVDLGSEEGQRLLRVVLVLTSSSVLLEQLDRLQIPVEQAADDVVWAIEALTDVVIRTEAKPAAATNTVEPPPG